MSNLASLEQSVCTAVIGLTEQMPKNSNTKCTNAEEDMVLEAIPLIMRTPFWSGDVTVNRHGIVQIEDKMNAPRWSSLDTDHRAALVSQGTAKRLLEHRVTFTSVALDEYRSLVRAGIALRVFQPYERKAKSSLMIMFGKDVTHHIKAEDEEAFLEQQRREYLHGKLLEDSHDFLELLTLSSKSFSPVTGIPAHKEDGKWGAQIYKYTSKEAADFVTSCRSALSWLKAISV